MTDVAVAFENVTKLYGSYQAITSVSFEINKGELISLLGPSGCGKTTTLRMIAGLEMPSSGRIVIGGRDVSRVPANQRSIGMVFQSYALFPHLTILDNVAYGLIAKGAAKKEAHARAMAQMEPLGLGAFAARLPAELSGGQQQRAALARVLVLEPEVLLFDEPLSNLDAKLRRQVRDEIRDLQLKLGLTVVYVTHDQTEALAISDRIFLMHLGRIEQSGPPRALYEAPSNTFVADFMGDANVVRLAAGPGGRVAFGRIELPPAEAESQPVTLVARPEHLGLTDPSGAGLPGRVIRASYLGGLIEYHVKTELGSLLVVSRDTRTPFSVDAEVCVEAAPENLRRIGA